MAIEFSTGAYEFSHGKQPRGTGCWAFQFFNTTTGRANREPWFAARPNGGGQCMPYAEAKKLAKAEAAVRGLGNSDIIIVLP